MPKQLQASMIELSPKLLPVFSAPLVLLYIGFSLYSVIKEKNIKTLELAATRDRLSTISAELAKVSPSRNPAGAASNPMAEIRAVLQNRVAWAEIYKELTVIVPEDVWFRELKSTADPSRKVIELTGSAVSQKKVAEFLTALEESDYFKNVSIKYSEKEEGIKPSLYRFEMLIPIQDEGSSV